jgi:uncharacterized protein YjbI with pentapeptide repeats
MKMKNNKKIAPLRSVRMTGMRSVIESNTGYGATAASISSTKDFSNNPNLKRSNFSNQDLRGANFSGSNLSGANFSGSNLSGANFSGATLEYSYYNYRIYDVNFENANLTNTNFTKAKISSEKIFKNATLTGALFTGATIYGNFDFSNIKFEGSLTINVGNGSSGMNFTVENNAKLILSGEADLVHAISHNGTWYGYPNFPLGAEDGIRRGPKLEKTLKLIDGEYINEITVGYSDSFFVIYYLEFKTNKDHSICMRPDIDYIDNFPVFFGDVINLKNIKVTNIAVGGGKDVIEYEFYNCLENISFTFTKG